MSTLTNIEEIRKQYQEKAEALQQEFFQYLRFQSISTDPDYKDDVLNCMEWVKKFLLNAGMQVETWETTGYPVIFASHCEAGAEKPTVLFYGHYDVQPIDPVEEWESPAFEPEVRDGEIYARGAQDNKGQSFYLMAAIRDYMEREGKLPINIKLCIEGEEEIGSPGIATILEKHRESLSADHLIVVDTGMPSLDRPVVTVGIRGMLDFTVEVTGSNTDLHSGSLGGLAYNPNHALVEMLSKLRDEDGRVTLPGFYDGIEEVTAEERALLDDQFDEEMFEKTFGSLPRGGEKGYSPIESNWMRPTLEINGIGGGYAGPGFKSVIPAVAQAKISCRLVPGQDAEKIQRAFSKFFAEKKPEGVEVQVHHHEGIGKALRSSPTGKAPQACARAITEVFGKDCAFVLEGASIPIAADLAQAAGSDTVLIGLGLPTDKIHAPNEHFGVKRLELGYLMVTQILQNFGAA